MDWRGPPATVHFGRIPAARDFLSDRPGRKYASRKTEADIKHLLIRYRLARSP